MEFDIFTILIYRPLDQMPVSQGISQNQKLSRYAVIKKRWNDRGIYPEYRCPYSETEEVNSFVLHVRNTKVMNWVHPVAYHHENAPWCVVMVPWHWSFKANLWSCHIIFAIIFLTLGIDFPKFIWLLLFHRTGDLYFSASTALPRFFACEPSKKLCISCFMFHVSFWIYCRYVIILSPWCTWYNHHIWSGVRVFCLPRGICRPAFQETSGFSHWSSATAWPLRNPTNYRGWFIPG